MFTHTLRTATSRLLAFLVFLIALVLASPRPEAAPRSHPTVLYTHPKTPRRQDARTPPLCRLYFTHADDPVDGLVGSGLTAAELRGCGFDAIETTPGSALQYRWLTEALTDTEIREALLPVVQAADGLPLWLNLNCVTQSGNPGPARTFYDPHNAAHRSMALANLEAIARIAAEYGIVHLGIDFETYGVTDPRYLYPAPWARRIGAELATALKRGNPQVELFGFAPLSFYLQYPGFRPLLRGWYGAAGSSGLVITEETYGMGGDVPRILRWARTLSGARSAAAGWFASDRAVDGAGWCYRCQQQLQSAVSCCPVVFVYREGPALWGTRTELRDAAGAVLRSLAP